MSVANNMEMELGTVESIAAKLLSVMSAANLAEIKTDAFEPLFNNSIATAFESTLPKACQTGDKKGKKISQLTSGTAGKEKDADSQGAGIASGLAIHALTGTGSFKLTVDSSETQTDNDKDMVVKPDDEANDFGQIMKDLDAESYIKMMQALSSMEKEELQEKLIDLDFAPALKQWLLTSPKIDADLKEIIIDMDPQVIQTNLKNILEHQSPANDLTQDIIYSFSQTDLSGEMFENMTVASAEEMVAAMGEFTSGEKVQQELLDIYEGRSTADLSQENVEFFKSLVDTVCAQTGIDYKDLLTNQGYASPLNECLQNVAQTFTYASVVSNYSNKSVGDLLLDLTKGV